MDMLNDVQFYIQLFCHLTIIFITILGLLLLRQCFLKERFGKLHVQCTWSPRSVLTAGKSSQMFFIIVCNIGLSDSSMFAASQSERLPATSPGTSVHASLHRETNTRAAAHMYRKSGCITLCVCLCVWISSPAWRRCARGGDGPAKCRQQRTTSRTPFLHSTTNTRPIAHMYWKSGCITLCVCLCVCVWISSPAWRRCARGGDGPAKCRQQRTTSRTPSTRDPSSRCSSPRLRECLCRWLFLFSLSSL